MSKINAVRLINLNYNNNAIRISDECFRLNGESTLLSLRNGGGKSVLVQMMMAPFVHKRYQNAKDRPFSGYFTTNKPTFIMVEWKLDQGAGYVLTGMMIRKNQEISEERQEELEMINFIAEYKERCTQDIFHLPVVEKTKKDVVLKGFHACKQLFESYKRERRIPFFYYDMNVSAQSKQYYDKLMEYQIYYKEWESIIKKVNLKESGLSDLFADCKDEKGLVEKWFLDAVESKLNKDKNRMKEFQLIIEKYIGQYKDNQSKIERRDTIRAFQGEAIQIKDRAVSFQLATEKLSGQEARIADFIRRLHQRKEEEELNADKTGRQIEGLKEQIFHLEYEKLSGEIYDITEKEKFSRSNLQMLQIEKEDLERKSDEISHKLHILLCAKQQESVIECEAERDREKACLLLCLEKEENLEPERKRLGAQLKHYYEILGGKKEEEKNCCENDICSMEQKQAEEKSELEKLQEEDGTLLKQSGALDAKIKAFDDVEENFNLIYQTDWHRNILGEYEPGALQICGLEYEKQLEELERDKTKAKTDAEQKKGEQKSLQRMLEDEMADKIRLESEKKETEKQLLDYERELSERRVILQYFGLEEEVQFDTEQILSAAKRKLLDTDLVRRELEKEADELEREYHRMAEGRTLELSEEFTKLLSDAGIHFVYGMEWLKKNQYSADQNKKLASEHPFLPYSIILSKQELSKISALPEKVYTSFPVPIFIREELEQKGTARKGALAAFGNLNFYVWFNDNLLEEEKLKEMLAKKDLQIKKIKKSMERKSREFQDYMEMQEKIKNQKVSKEGYESAKEKILGQKQKLSELDLKLLQKREMLGQLERLLKQSEQQALALEQKILNHRRCMLDFEKLCQSYAAYQENFRLFEKNKKERERILNKQELKKERIQKLEEKRVTEKNKLFSIEQELKSCEEKQAYYRQYDSMQEELKEEFTPEWAESRYEAIASGISAQQKELELRLTAAEKRYQRAADELRLLQEKHRILKEDFLGTAYDRREEAHQEALLEEQEQKIIKKNDLIHDEEINCALLNQELKNKYSGLWERCKKKEPIAKEEILTIDFASAMKKLEYEKGEAEKEEKGILKKIQAYEGNLAALAEYEPFVCDREVEWECDFSAMPGEEITKQKGILVRDYQAYLEQRREARLDLERELNRIIRQELFAEDFYQKPLESMLQLTEDAGRVLKQLETTLASYQSLMEKLLVDISLVEKEKSKIAELVGDYLKEVHDNLNKIDQNSTITIRERPIKMLKIELLDWAENESFYELRLLDYIDDITAKGIALLEENKNAAEYIGTRVTTKNLYDAVVGIGNVQIRLYKVEAQREYPITWAEVAKNSGGEGFLSAFVILSSLLYYMRREDTDIFADKNEGKVLVMDNPFAQTNASHLLKPLMDMAKKTNTQLICLSGLGGEAIYGCFDNIYVLTLIAANLRSGMQYLKAEHMRGSKEEEMIVSQIEVLGQQELVF